jgi:DHA1 family tetracycline resistance protein-like MFS transporter
MQETPEKLDFKRILPIFVIVLVDLLGLTIIIPLLPLYAVSFGADPFTIGVIAAAYPMMQLIGGPILGALSDKYGRKPVLMISQFGTFIGFLILGFANGVPVLLLSRIIDGLSGANIVVAQAAITDVTTPKTRTQGLGLIGAAFGLGFTLGPALAGIALAVTDNNYQVPAFMAAAFSFGSILLTAFWFKETKQTGTATPDSATARKGVWNLSKFGRALRNPLIGTLLLLMFAQQLVFGGFENLLALFNLSRLGLNASANSGLFVFIGIIAVVVQGYMIGKWSRRFGERKLIFAGLLLLGIGIILAAITPPQPVPWYSRAEMLGELGRDAAAQVSVELPDDSNTGVLGLVWMMIALVPATIGGSILSPSINSLITKNVARTEIGATLGVSSSLLSLANVITPILGGGMFQFLGSTAPFLIGGIALALLMWMSMRRLPPAVSATA